MRTQPANLPYRKTSVDAPNVERERADQEPQSDLA